MPAALVVVLCGRWLSAVALPFALGTLVALAAEPVTGRLGRRMPRTAATALGVTLTLALLAGLAAGVISLGIRQLSTLAAQLPRLLEDARHTLTTLHGGLLTLAEAAPQPLRQTLRTGVDGLFADGGTLVEGLLQQLPDAAATLTAGLVHSLLTLGTACIAAYLISARLPALKSHPLTQRWLPRLRQVRRALWCWLKAQLRLSGVSFLVVLTGLWLLKIARPVLWAALIAVVDAVPLLGTGTVLLPWAAVSLLQGSTVQGLGLLGIYALAAVTRSILEPRLVGSVLGLDSLVTLVAIYAGFRAFGFWGVLAAPVVCVICREAAARR